MEINSTPPEIITSKQYTIDYRDLLKGLLMAVIVPVLLIVQTSIEAGIWTFDWQKIGMAAVAGGIGYLIKNFFAKSEIKIQQQ